MFYMEQKKRFCAQARAPGSQYCGVHSQGEAAANKKRIPCPIDPGHTIYEFNLRKHVAKCTKTRELHNRAAKPYYKQQANCGVAPVSELDAIVKLRGGATSRIINAILVSEFSYTNAMIFDFAELHLDSLFRSSN